MDDYSQITECVRARIREKELDLEQQLVDLEKYQKRGWLIIEILVALLGGFCGSILYNIIECLTQ